MRENLRIGRGPFDMDGFGCVHLDDANYAAVRCKRNSEGRSSIDQTGSRKPTQSSDIPYAIPKCSLVKLRHLCSALKGRKCVHLPRYSSETGHPPRCEEGLPTFTLEKLVPGGIAEVSPSHGRAAGEGQATPGCRRGSNPRANCNCLWVSRIIIVIMKAGVIPPTIASRSIHWI